MNYVRKILGACTTLAMCVGLANPAFAHDGGQYLDVALLGDSYTAGNGAGSYYGPENAYRSTRNWGHVYVDWLNEQGVRTTIRNLAVSGGVTKDVLERQIPLLDPKTDLVMLTIGGNDIKFEEIVKNCFVKLYRSYNGCEAAMKYAEKTFPATREQIVRVFEAIQSKLADDARIVLVGYPLLSIESDYTVPGWFWGAYPAAEKVREFGQFATREQTRLVQEWNENPANKVKVTFVPTELHFAGHEPDPDTDKRNPLRWLNEMLEDAGDIGPDGVIISESTGLFEFASWYHPNIAGHREIANLLKQNVGVPKNVREHRSTSRDVDVVFAVETTEVTAGKLGEIKSQITRIMGEVNASAAEAGALARFALVSFRDLPAPVAPSGDEATVPPMPGPTPPSAGDTTPGSNAATPGEEASPSAEKASSEETAPSAEKESGAEKDSGTEVAPSTAAVPSSESTDASTVEPTSQEDKTDAAINESADGNKVDAPSRASIVSPVAFRARLAMTDPAPEVEPAQGGDSAPAVEPDQGGEHAPDTQPAQGSVEPLTRLVELGAEGLDTALAGLAANGPHAQSAFYPVLNDAINQFDRPEARKLVVVLGDLDSANNEPAEWDSLAANAFAKTTAEIIGIDINGTTSENFTSLARRTGGYVTTTDVLKPKILPEPVAVLKVPELVKVGDPVTLDASGSTAEGFSISRYEWDVDNDGTFDIVNTGDDTTPPATIATHTWDTPTDATVTLQIVDQYGRRAQVSTSVKVTLDGDLIEDGDNCPLHPNPDQADEDRDGIGDVCDPTPHGVEAVSENPPTVDLPIAEIAVVPPVAPYVDLPIAQIGVVPDHAPTLELPLADVAALQPAAPRIEAQRPSVRAPGQQALANTGQALPFMSALAGMLLLAGYALTSRRR